MAAGRLVAGRRLWLAAGALAVVLVATGVTLAVAYPTVGAVACPRCYGFEPLTAGAYIERGRTTPQREQVRDALATADLRIRDFFGGRRSRPRVLACGTAPCYDRIGGGREKGRAFLNRAVILSPNGTNPVIATHELAHIELHERLGSDATGHLPRWFDEGLAVVVSDDARYLGPADGTDRCLVSWAEARPVTQTRGRVAISKDERFYTKAGCAVSRWLSGNGGSRAVAKLVQRMARGEPFEAIVKV